jgi:Tfp pilus assembly protein PilN
MLRINLLPPYIYEGKKKKTWGLVWGLATAATVAGFMLYLSSLNQTLAEEDEKKRVATELQGQYNTLVGQIDGVKRQIAETETKQKFIADSQVYNDSWREGFLLVREVINPRIVIKAINFDQTRSSVIMQGFAPSEVDTIRWWMVLLKQADKFTNVNITLPPHGYEPGAAAGAPGAMGGMAAGSMGGSMGGAPNFAATAGVASAGGGSMGGYGAMMGGRGPMGGGSMGGMGGGAQSGDAGVGTLDGRTGFHFVCTAGLKNPLKGGPVAPAWPPAGGTGAAPGGMGMMGGGSMGSMMMGGGSMGMSGSAGMAPAPAASGNRAGSVD